MYLSYRFRLRDTAASELSRQARAVSWVWNFCRDTQQNALRWGKRWPSGYDLINLTSGSSKEIGLHAHTIQSVCLQYANSRQQHRRPLLRWRGKKSLGWVPFNKGHVVYRDGSFVFRGRSYPAWVTRDLVEGQTFLHGSFNQDSEGHWYINLTVEVESLRSDGVDAIGIDLGLKELACISTGEKIEHPRWHRKMEQRIAIAQRARKKRQSRTLHAKVKARRRDHLHKVSTRLVQSHGAIFVGNVSSAGLARTRMAKSVLDAGWSQFRTYLAYKAIRHGVVFQEVNEAFSTQTCSSCESRSGPKGLKDLGIRRWTCACGAVHDRDVNAARNIARAGLGALAEGAMA